MGLHLGVDLRHGVGEAIRGAIGVRQRSLVIPWITLQGWVHRVRRFSIPSGHEPGRFGIVEPLGPFFDGGTTVAAGAWLALVELALWSSPYRQPAM